MGLFRRRESHETITGTMMQAKYLLRNSEGFLGWLQAHGDEVQNDRVLEFLRNYLRDNGIEARLYYKTFPVMEVDDEQLTLWQHWIINLQWHFGEWLTRPVSAQEVCETISGLPSTYSIVPAPPER